MENLLIINASPREDGVCSELIKQITPYFIECKTIRYNAYALAAAPCNDCKYCEYHNGCSNSDLDVFFEDFEAADYIIFASPVYNNFFPAPMKAIIDRFQRYFNLRFKLGAKTPIEKPKKIGVVIASGSNARSAADFMTATLKQAFSVLNGQVLARYYIPNTDVGRYTFNNVELQKFIHQMKAV